ncbi:hypothetical protein GDO78_019553 [Eleutherodactylus coqui]|uniref:Uncharacterized protein n=1 Tax=Eleutherodactylus coqui TaxID=57060 RepID=A0A8J6B7N7_ELECQ|nr:hypothetical protein GDO78_019553 [Eleutherodactylus coqui]
MGDYVHMNKLTCRYVSQWDFQGASLQELSFKAGDCFQPLDVSGDWWLVERLRADGSRTGKTGYVPYNYMVEEGTLEEQPWFFGELSRTEAVNLLLRRGNATGSFLVRVSDKQGFMYALSVRSGDTVKHFKILQQDGGEYHLGLSNYFADLNKLIEFYKVKTVATDLLLTSPCQKVSGH